MKKLNYQHLNNTTEALEYSIDVTLEGAIVYIEVFIEDEYSSTLLINDFKHILQMMEKVIDSELNNVKIAGKVPYGCTYNCQKNSLRFFAYNLNNRIDEMTEHFATNLGYLSTDYQAVQGEYDEEGGAC